jgi:homocysteine S-methyltransferase
MSELLQSLQHGPLLADGAMGSLLFERTGRLSEPNHVYEAFNADRPDLVLQVHLAYLQAGARCLTTNTFGTSRDQLAAFGLAGRTGELNRAGVAVARRAIDDFVEQSRAEGPFHVLGSIGPHREPTNGDDERLRALVEAGVDAILLETFTDLEQATALIERLQSLAPDLPILAGMALQQRPEGGWSLDPARFLDRMTELGVAAAGVNCCAPREALAFLDAVHELPAVRERRVLLSAMPNGADFHRIGHRYLTGVNPEFMGNLARQLADRGVKLIGGCCEVHPPHLAEMHNYLQGRLVGRSRTWGGVPAAPLPPIGDEVKRTNGPLSRKLKDGGFGVSVEMLPPRGTGGLKGKLAFVEALAGSGLADAVDLTDGSRGIPLMPPGDFIGVIRSRLGWSDGDRLELIPHFTTRDLNAMGLQSRLMGYWARNIHNVLFVTGDPPKMSPTYPRSTAVFDLDSAAMIRYAHACLNAGVDFGGQPLGPQADPRTRFTVGSGFEPEALDPAREVERLERKLEAGADYILTQPAFRPEPLAVLEPFRGRAAFLVGVLILTGLAHAQRMAQVPGVIVPAATLEQLARYRDPEDQAKAGRQLAVEQIRWVRQEGWSGLYLMSPATHQPVLEVLTSGLG